MRRLVIFALIISLFMPVGSYSSNVMRLGSGNRPTVFNMLDYWHLMVDGQTDWKDLSICPGGVGHLSMDSVITSDTVHCTFDGVDWYGYHWGFVIRDSDESIMGRADCTSLMGVYNGYIVISKDWYWGPDPKFGNRWTPYKNQTGVTWTVNSYYDNMLNLTTVNPDNTECDYATSAPEDKSDKWVFMDVLKSVTNTFWDSTSKTWTGSILHIREYEYFQDDYIDYYFLNGTGLIRLVITTISTATITGAAGAYQ